MAVHQLLPRFHLDEPAALAAVELQHLLRSLGQWGELYALEREEGTGALVRPLESLRVRAEDRVLLHHDRDSALPARLLHLPCLRGVVFGGFAPAPDDSLRAARAQLAGLSEPGALGLGLSDFAAAELRRTGWSRVHAVPLFVEPERFGPDRAEAGPRTRLPSAALTVIASGGPDGRDDVLRLHRELQRLRPDARLLLLGGEPDPDVRLAGVEWLAPSTHGARVAALRSGSVWLSMAERDGRGHGLLEAMAAELPVLAFGAGAALEALGGAGVAFTEKRIALLAELVVRLATDTALRARILDGQRRRLAEQGPAESARRLGEALDAPPRSARPGAPGRPRVAVVVQRYGPGVTGGAEALARQVVQRLAPHWDIRVLTSCAVDHLTWANAFPEGEETLDGVPVVRFPTRAPRPMHQLNALSRRVFGRSLSLPDEERWMALQGPLLPGLWRHLAEEGDGYDGVVAFTALYVSTAWTVPMVGPRTLLVPTAHDEPPLQFDAYREVFQRPAALLLLSEEEAALVDRRFPGHASARVVGVGVEAPATVPEAFRKRFGVDGPFLLYVGRVERGKGIPELLALYAGLRRRRADAPALVLAGESSMDVNAEGVRVLGRIGEQEKWDGLAAAAAVVVPSARESLSLLALEAFAVGTPVVGNAASAVVAGHLERSGAGFGYRDAESFEQGVDAAIADRERLSRAARRHAQTFSWTRVVDAYREELARVMERR